MDGWKDHKKATSQRWGEPISQTYSRLLRTQVAVQDALAACEMLDTVRSSVIPEVDPEAGILRTAAALPPSGLPAYTSNDLRLACQALATAWVEDGPWRARPGENPIELRDALDEVLSCAGHPDWRRPSSLVRGVAVVGADAELAAIAAGPSKLYSRTFRTAVEVYGDLVESRSALIIDAHAVFAARIRTTVLEAPTTALKSRKECRTWRSVATDILAVEAVVTVEAPVAAELEDAVDAREAALDRANAAYWARLGTPRGVDRSGVPLSAEWTEQLVSLSRREGLRNLTVRVSDTSGRSGTLTGVSRRVVLDAELLECKSRDVAQMFQDNGSRTPMESMHLEWLAGFGSYVAGADRRHWNGPFMVQTGQPGFADLPEYMEINLRNTVGEELHFLIYSASLTLVRFESGDEWEEADTSDWGGGLSVGFQASWEDFFSDLGACN